MDNLKDRVTIYEVAKEAGVSLATVSRVINGSDTVSKKTRIKINEVIDRLGYKPNGVAQALATNKTTNIGVIIPSANYVYIANMLNGITTVCKQKGYTLSLYTTSHSRHDAISCIERVIKSKVDGVIVFDDELDTDDLRTINSYSVSVICINNRIVSDRTGCIYFGYEHLIKNIIEDNFLKGNKKMTFLHVHNCGNLLSRIEKQFVKVHQDNDHEFNIMNCDDSYQRTYQDFVERFKKGQKEYVVAYRDSIAAAVLNAATDCGLRVPEDVEVLSIIGTKYASIIRPQISDLYIDFQEVGRRAMLMLGDLMEGRLIDKECKFESEYRKKQSTIF